jgi:hypothetical protein
MKDEDLKRFVVVMGVMGESFQKEPSEALSSIYWRTLQDMPIETFEAACMTLLNTRKITGTFPMVAEIREAAAGGPQSKAVRAAIAWDKLRFAIATECPYNSVAFDDPIIYHIVRAWGGWTEMGSWLEEDNHWKRKEFVQLYEAYAANEHLPDPDHHLVGLTEAHNRELYPDYVPKIVMIGGSTGQFTAIPFEAQEQKRLVGEGKKVDIDK